MKRRVMLTAGVVVGTALLVFALLSRDLCGDWPRRSAQVALVARSKQSMRAGAARVGLALPFPLPPGGYGPPRSVVNEAGSPLSARALVVDVGGQVKAFVLLDVLLVTPQLRDAIAREFPFGVITLATHTHAGPGAYSRNAASEWAALGNYRADVEAALVAAAREALEQARAGLMPVELLVGETNSSGLTAARSSAEADARVTKLLFASSQYGEVAQLLVVAAHPTLVERNHAALHGDWPALLAEELERDGGPVTLVLQGAAGNASVNRAQHATPQAFAQALREVLTPLPLTPQPAEAAWSEVHVALPRPEATRLTAAPLRALVENALCDDAETLAVLHAVRLGNFKLLFVPGEPSYAAGRLLEDAAQAQRLVSLADGYVGYVEPLGVVHAGEGEARRQYFPAELISLLVDGARLAGDTAK